jgi:plastocyanin
MNPSAAALVGFALFAVSCMTDPVDAAEANVVGVDINPTAFDPQQTSVKVNQMVRWTWTGGSHNVVSGKNCQPDDAFRSGAPQEGGSFEKKFEKDGTFDYYCEVHCSQGMTGQVIVAP